MPEAIGSGYARADGRKGIRNIVAVVHLVECSHHVAREIALSFRAEHGFGPVQLIGFKGCYPNDHAERVMNGLCTHPNVGAVLLVSLGCESFDRRTLLEAVRASGRPAELVVIQETGGTAAAIEAGQAHVRTMLETLKKTPRTPVYLEDLVVSTVCGGSDATSGISANPAVGRFFDRFTAAGGTGIFEETGELIGCEAILRARGATPEIGEQVVASVEKAARYYTAMGHSSFAPGNAEGGLTTIEEKSLGAYAKSGSCKIEGLIYPGQRPKGSGLWLLDVVPDGEPMHGFPNLSDVAEISEMASCGAHINLYTSGRGSVAGSAIAPTVKVCGNPDTYRRMSADMDINAGAIMEGTASIDDVADQIMQLVKAMANGTPSKPEKLGHYEFELQYKRYNIQDSFSRGHICG